jgi:DNA recombination protein RmuC
MTAELSPELLAAAAGGLLVLALLALAARLGSLARGQSALAGALERLSRSQTALEGRLTETAARIEDGRAGTDHALGSLHERLAAIDRAQENLERLSGDVLSLQDILSNKQARGSFGEVQLRDILGDALPPSAWAWQPTLANGRRPDAVICLPHPPGPIAVDAKFTLESFEALQGAESTEAKAEAARAFRTAIRAHLRAIAGKYVAAEGMADGALMFLPSEAVYAALHGQFPELVREAFAARVWIVSPTTCMATLVTLRAVLKDVRLREETHAIRSALGQLHREIETVARSADRLATHLGQSRADLDALTGAAQRAKSRADRIDRMDLDPQDDQDGPRPVRIFRSQGFGHAPDA